ncbi:MAG: hypothetical protein HRT92_08045 [Piscirickettsiaceae bacterium]|nr:hypothetical protein [Piscirickettsiaceae bacterium]
MRNPDFPYLPKDFIQTKEGLIFAVVSYLPQEGKVGCFLRYIPSESGWKKVDTEQANQLLQQSYPQYYYQSKQFDTVFHAVAVNDITQHYRPEQRLQAVLQREPRDEIERKLQMLIPILVRLGVDCHLLGLTGSMLINQQQEKSDIDLAVYGRIAFQQTRQAVRQALIERTINKLNQSSMKDNFQRRAGELSFDEFSWHENRKLNKAVIEGCKFDIGMVCLADELEIDQNQNQYQKKGLLTIKTKVIDDDHAFDYPAIYKVDNALTPYIVSFTHTYVGQAKVGEEIEVSGTVECDVVTGKCRLIVGSTREAKGEYIKVCR